MSANFKPKNKLKMSQLLYGSINYDALLKELKTGKIKTFKTEAGVRLSM